MGPATDGSRACSMCDDALGLHRRATIALCVPFYPDVLEATGVGATPGRTVERPWVLYQPGPGVTPYSRFEALNEL